MTAPWPCLDRAFAEHGSTLNGPKSRTAPRSDNEGDLAVRPVTCTVRPLAGAAAAFLLLALNGPSQAVKVDPTLSEYKPVQGVSGSIKSVGSDTMLNMMTNWAESFKKLYPSVTVEIEGKGSGTAPPALIAGTANFGPMSRSMKDQERDDFEKKFGYKPTQVATSIDMLAVYV